MVSSLLVQQEELILSAMIGGDYDDEDSSQDQANGGETGESVSPPSAQRPMTQRIFQATTRLVERLLRVGRAQRPRVIPPLHTLSPLLARSLRSAIDCHVTTNIYLVPASPPARSP